MISDEGRGLGLLRARKVVRRFIHIMKHQNSPIRTCGLSEVCVVRRVMVKGSNTCKAVQEQGKYFRASLKGRLHTRAYLQGWGLELLAQGCRCCQNAFSGCRSQAAFLANPLAEARRTCATLEFELEMPLAFGTPHSTQPWWNRRLRGMKRIQRWNGIHMASKQATR